MIDHPSTTAETETDGPRPPCPAPADVRAEIAEYDRRATVGQFRGPRHRMTYRVLGDGPTLVLLPGIASTYRGYCLTLNRLAERFQTVLFDYPGDNRDDEVRLGKVRHFDLVDDVFRLLDHLNVGRAFLFGLSFGSTITLGALRREPRRFPRAAVQGGFAYRRFSAAERFALRFGRLVPGTVDRLPFQRRILEWNNRGEFPALLDDRWDCYVEQNGLTPIAPFAARLDLLGRLDLRAILPEIPNEILVLQGNEDRIVPRSAYETLIAGLPNAQGLIVPVMGHQPHYTHAELLAHLVGDFLLPCAPGGCPQESESG